MEGSASFKLVDFKLYSGLSRRKQGFDSPWGYLFYKELWRFDFENEPKSRGKNVGTFFL